MLVGQFLTIAGFLAYRQGEYGQAEELLTEGYGRLSQLGDDVPGVLTSTGLALVLLGSTDLIQEQFDRAASVYREGLKLAPRDSALNARLRALPTR